MDDVSQIASRSPALRRLLQTLEQEGGMQSDVDRSYEMVAQDQEQSDSVESEAGSLGLLPVRPAQLRQLRFSRARLESTCARDPNRRAPSVAPSPAPVWRAAAVASSGVGFCCEGGPFFREWGGSAG